MTRRGPCTGTEILVAEERGRRPGRIDGAQPVLSIELRIAVRENRAHPNLLIYVV